MKKIFKKQVNDKKGNIRPDLSLDREEQIELVKQKVKNTKTFIFSSKSEYRISPFLKDNLAKSLSDRETDIVYIKQQRNDDLLYNIKQKVRSDKCNPSIVKAVAKTDRVRLKRFFKYVRRFLILASFMAVIIEFIAGIIGLVIGLIAEFSPYVLSRVVKKVTNNPNSGEKLDLNSAWLSKFFKNYNDLFPNRVLYFIMDEVQHVDADVFEEWVRLFKQSTIDKFYCIYVFSDINDIEDNENYRTLAKSGNNCYTTSFPAPTVKLIKEIYEKYTGKTLNDKMARDILSQSGKNAETISHLIEDNSQILYTPIDKKVLRLLSVYSNSLSKDVIYKICKNSADENSANKTSGTIINNSQEFDMCLEKLKKLNLISEDCNGEYYCYTYTQSQLDLRNLNNDVGLTEICQRDLLDYYFTEIGADKLTRSDLTLAYRFAKVWSYSDKQIYAKKILIDYLKNGGKIESKGNIENTNDILEDSGVLLHKTEIDCYIASLYYYLHNDYEQALEQINHVLEEKRNTGNFIKLNALIMNRLRNLKEAKTLLEKSLEQEKNPSQQPLLLAILVSVHLHSNDLPRIGELYATWKTQMSEHENWGYFLRNVAWHHKDREKLYKKAIEKFENSADDFGRFTVLANWGNAYIETDRALAFKKLNEAKKGLELFGEHKCCHVYNDLGISYLLNNDTGDVEKAKVFFEMACNVNKEKMPFIFSSINLACCYVRTNEFEKALKLMVDLEAEVVKYKLDRVREKYYVNRLFIEFVNGAKDLKSWINKVAEYPDRYYPKRTYDLLYFYGSTDSKYNPELFNKLYSPCNLAYWDINPFKILDNSLLDKALTT